MKRHLPVLAGTLAALTLTGTATAQTTGVLNTIEVQRLVWVDTATAHLMLSRHYMALADMFASEAARFDALATVPTGNPNHRTASGVDVRRMHQADGAAALSEAGRRMAAYHQFLSMGITPAATPAAALFDSGFGARVPTAAELNASVAAAHSSADHRVLEEYFRTLAERSAADAKAHATMANNFRVTGQRRGSEVAATHCDHLAKEARKAARQATAAAALHHRLAEVG